MHALAPLIKDLAIILGVASIVTFLFQKIKQPIVLGYLFAGIIVGPYTPPHVLITDVPNIKILSELGVIFLMFTLGLEFSFKKLRKVGFTAGISGLFEVFFMLILGYLTGRLIGWSFYDSVFLGACLSISSTTIIIKALEDLKLKTQDFSEMVFGILIVEDLLAILLLVALSTVVATNHLFSSEILGAAVKLVLVTGSWFLLGYFFLLTFFRKFMRDASNESLTIFSIALCLTLVCIADYFNYSSALGAFVMGSILAETTVLHKIEKLMEPLKNIFAGVFFVSVGMLIDPLIIWHHIGLVIIICFVTIIGKVLTTGIGAFFSGQTVHNSIRIGFSMAQIGEFSFVIASLGLALNVINNSLYPIIVAVSAVTTFSTPYLIKFSGVFADKTERSLPVPIKKTLLKYTEIINQRITTNKQKNSKNISIFRMTINAFIIAIIFTAIQHWGLIRLSNLINHADTAKIVGWAIAVLFSFPFILGMSKSFSYYSRLALFFSSLLTFIEIIFLSFPYFNNLLSGSILFLIAAGLFIGIFKYINHSYQWLEKQLMKNLDKQK